MHRSPASGHDPRPDACAEVRRFLTGADVRPEFAARVLARIHAEHDRRARALLTAATQRAGEADVLLCELRRLLERPA